MATLGELRLAVGDELNDVLQVTVTANALNSTTRLYAVGQINQGAETNVGREIVFTSGGNMGEIRRVLQTNPRDGWLEVDRVLPTAIATGDLAELYGFRGRGWAILSYHRNINRAIADASPAHKGTPIEAVIATAFDSDAPSVSVPQLVNWVARVEYLPAGATLYQEVPMAEDRLFRGWSVDAPNEALVFRGDDILTQMDGATIKVVGFRKAQPLVEEDDRTSVPDRFIIEFCKHHMLMSGMDREQGGDNRYNRAMVAREDKDLRAKLSLRTRGLGARAKWVRD